MQLHGGRTKLSARLDELSALYVLTDRLYRAYHGVIVMLEGHSPWKAGEQNPEAIFVSDIAETDEPAVIKDRIISEGIVGLAFIPLTVQGQVVGKFMTYHDRSHTFDSHEIDLATAIARQIGFYLERTRSEEARKIAEDELRASEQQFRLMVEQAPVMIWTCDAFGKCTNLNSMLREFWGVESHDVPIFNWHTTIHPDDAADVGR